MSADDANADATTERVRRHLRITGDVQGVFFRASTRDVARDNGVTGWVQNNPDGSVEAEVQGPQVAVNRVVAFCRTGPDYARVVDLQITTIDAISESRFRIC